MQIQNDENELQKAIDDIAKNAAGSSEVSDLDAKVQDQLGVPPVPEMDVTIPEVPDMPVGLEVPAGMGEMPMPGGDNLTVGAEIAATPTETEVAGEVVTETGPVAPDESLTIDEDNLPKIEIKETAPVEGGAEESSEVAAEADETETTGEAVETTEAATEKAEEPAKEAEKTETEKTEVKVESTTGATPSDLKDVKTAALKDLYPLLEKIQVNAEQKCKIYREAYEATGDKEIIPKMYEAIKGLEDERMRAEQLLWVVGL